MSSTGTAAQSLLATALHLKDFETFNRFKSFSWSLVFVVNTAEVARIVEGDLFEGLLFEGKFILLKKPP